MYHYLYLYINFAVVLFPFVFSFHRRLKFHKQFSPFFISTFLVGFVFVIWDVYFTNNGLWGFNEEYIIGLDFFSLPIEELLFFFCIPYACVFSYHVLESLYPINDSELIRKGTYLFSIILFSFGCFYLERWYTSITFVSLSILLLIARNFINLFKFYRAYLILLIPFLITNGILTGSFINHEVVWYNDKYNLGVRVFTIPIEDVFYGMLLLLFNIMIYEKLRKVFFKSPSKSESP